MSGLVGNPDCLFSHAEAHIDFIQLNVKFLNKRAEKLKHYQYGGNFRPIE